MPGNWNAKCPSCGTQYFADTESEAIAKVKIHMETCGKTLKCDKCQGTFADGEEATTIDSTDRNQKKKYYHKSCYQELEKEQNNPNSPNNNERCFCSKCNPLNLSQGGIKVCDIGKPNPNDKKDWKPPKEPKQPSNKYTPTNCQDCKKQIKAGEKCYSETIPDSFSPQTVYYCKSCGEQRQNKNIIKLCKDCGLEMYSSVCQRCAVNWMIKGHLSGFGNSGSDDKKENEEKCIDCLNSRNNHKPDCVQKCGKCNGTAVYNGKGKSYDKSKCFNKNCENDSYKHLNDPNKPLNKFRKGGCKKCNKNNVWLGSENSCIDCGLKKTLVALQKLLKEVGRQEVLKWWESMKTERERAIREIRGQNPELAQKFEKAWQTIESDLYPERKKQEDKKGETIKRVVIGSVIIVIAVIIGLIIYFLCRKKEK